MVELVDAVDSKSIVERRAGSSPARGTRDSENEWDTFGTNLNNKT